MKINTKLSHLLGLRGLRVYIESLVMPLLGLCLYKLYKVDKILIWKLCSYFPRIYINHVITADISNK
jgi:hypothetical protein